MLAGEDGESGSGPNEMKTHKHSGSQAEPTGTVPGLKGFLGGCRDVGPPPRAGWCPHKCRKAKGTRGPSGFSGETGKRWRRRGEPGSPALSSPNKPGSWQNLGVCGVRLRGAAMGTKAGGVTQHGGPAQH